MGTQSLAGFAFFFKWPSAWIAVATGLCVGAVLLALRRPARAQDSLSDVGLVTRSEEHTSELQSRLHLVCRLLLEKKKTIAHNRVHRAHAARFSSSLAPTAI